MTAVDARPVALSETELSQVDALWRPPACIPETTKDSPIVSGTKMKW